MADNVDTKSCVGFGVAIHLEEEANIQAIGFSVLTTESVLNVGADTVIHAGNVSVDGITLAGNGTVESVLAERNNTNIQTSDMDVTVGEGVSGTAAGEVELESGSSSTTSTDTDYTDSNSGSSGESISGSNSDSASNSGSNSGSSSDGDDNDQSYASCTTTTPDPELEVPELPSREPEESKIPEKSSPKWRRDQTLLLSLSESTAYIDLSGFNSTVKLCVYFPCNTDISGLN